MSELTNKYSKNYSPARKKEFERRVREIAGNMSEESAADLVAKEMREEKKDGDFLPIVNHFQNLTIEVMPIGVVYKFYCSLLPKKKTFLRYLSGKKTKTNEKVVPFIQEYFEVSKLQASEYYKLMTTDEIKSLLKKYGKTDKEIKKMGVK